LNKQVNTHADSGYCRQSL